MLDRKIEEKGAGSVLTLYGDVTVQSAAELRGILLEQLAVHSDLTIDLSYVTNCDLSLFQLICATHKRSVKDAKTVRMGDCSASIKETASSGGFLRTSGCVSDTNEKCLWHCENAGVKHE